MSSRLHRKWAVKWTWIHFPLPAEVMLFAVKTMVLCYTLHLGCSRLIFQREAWLLSPSSCKTVGIGARMGAAMCPSRLPQSSFEVARGLKGQSALTHSASMGQQLRGNRKSILISCSEGKPGYRWIRVHFSLWIWLNPSSKRTCC